MIPNNTFHFLGVLWQKQIPVTGKLICPIAKEQGMSNQQLFLRNT